MFLKQCDLTLNLKELITVELLLLNMIEKLSLPQKILNSYFSTVYSCEDISTILILESNFPNISPIIIHNEDVINLKEHKAKGPDEIPTILLKRLSTIISPALTLILQASLHQ